MTFVFCKVHDIGKEVIYEIFRYYFGKCGRI